MNKKKYLITILFAWTLAGFSRENETFQTEFLTYLGHNDKVELIDTFKTGNHFVSVYINNKKIGTENVEFKNELNDIKPCFSQLNLSKFNLNYDKINQNNELGLDCVFIDKLLKGAYTTLDFDDERLDINIPQIYLSSEADDYIYPSQWSKGQNSYALKYDMNITNIRTKNHNNSYSYRGYFDQHLNLASWHIYTSNVFTVRNDSSTYNKFNDLYAEHAIASLKSALTVGEITTNSDYFSWVKYKGIKLASDERMNPTSLSGFAPLVRGIANSPSLLSIEYNGRIIYEKNIPSGEYNITDLPQTYGSGYLNVILTGADGSKTVQEIPISTMANLIRPGSYEYSVNIGSLDTMYPGNYWLTQADVKYGINNNLTIYSSVQSILPNDYSLAMVGGAFNTGIGGFSVDYYRSYTDERNTKKNNSSCNLFCKDKIALNYEEDIEYFDTNISMSLTRYLDKNYLELNDFMTIKYDHYINNGFNSSKYKQVSNVTFKKILPDSFGGISTSGYYAQSWNGQGKDSYSYSVTYSNHIGRLNYNTSFFTYRNDNDKLDNTFFLSFDFPLETKNKNINLSSTYMNYADSYNTRVSVGINDKSIEKPNVNVWYDKSSQNNLGYGTSLYYNNGIDSKQIGYSKNENSKMFYGSLNGAIVLHKGGINRSSELSKTYSIVKAVGAEGMRVSSNSNIKIEQNGYGIVPYLSPYKRNYITLDSKKSKNMSDLEENKLLVIPEAGASPLVEFKVNRLFNNIFKINSDKYNIPFGARVIDEENNVLGMTDQSGFVFLSKSSKEKGVMRAVWSQNNQDYSCILNPLTNDGKEDSVINVNCI